MFSDGSKKGDDTTWAYSIWRDNQEVTQSTGRLRDAEVFDGEATGARQGLQAALRLDN